MKEEEIQMRAIEFQEMYYPSNTAPLNQNDQAEALRFAYAQGWEMAMNKINRIEVIDQTGRAYIHYLNENESVRYSLQDDNQTLKIFIDKSESAE